MSTNSEQFLDKITRLDDSTTYQFTNSSKVYVQGSRSDLLVPMREIKLSDTLTDNGNEPNAPLRVYDTSGLYSDKSDKGDPRTRLPAIRAPGIDERDDPEVLPGESSTFGKLRNE